MRQKSKTQLRAIAFALAVVLLATSAVHCHAGTIHHYVFFAQERERIAEKSFLESKAFEGAQLKYTWRELEPEKNVYDFSAIRHDLKFLHEHGKKLWLQIQDSSFDTNHILVPVYLTKDPAYHGGADPQYEIAGDDDSKAVAAGWVGRRWDPAVQERYHLFLRALGKEFDGKVAGINLPETAVDFGTTGKLFPKGFTPAVYRDAIITNLIVLKAAFPKSIAMQYANFMPGEWLPWTDHHYLRDVCKKAQQIGVALGGPDLIPYRKGQMSHTYAMMREYGAGISKGIAVQDGNYATKDPKTKKRMTVEELIGFADQYLQVDYIFWCTEQPYYSRDLIPFLNGAGK